MRFFAGHQLPSTSVSGAISASFKQLETVVLRQVSQYDEYLSDFAQQGAALLGLPAGSPVKSMAVVVVNV